jgi:diaminopimelate decarboxylase
MATTRSSSGDLVLGGLRLADVVGAHVAGAAKQPIGTPTYIYDLDGIAAGARALHAAFEGAAHTVAYAVKANSAGPVVRCLRDEGCGADVVSGAELGLALACGVAPEAIVYSGVAKADDELDRAILAGPEGIRAIQIESVEEIARVAARAAAHGRVARVSLRVNPSLDAGAIDTHAHITTGHDEAKFGVAREDVATAIGEIERSGSLALEGLTVHAGSQLTATQGYVAAARTVFELARDLRARHPLRYVDTGGGFGIDYGEGCPVGPSDFVRAVREEQARFGLGDLELFVEPGRSLVAAHGVLVARIIQAKVSRAHRWLMIDAGMNDLIRPALYQAFHRVVPLGPPGGAPVPWRVVGPVCESSDDFGVHMLPADPPDMVAILDAGAYGYTMASQYNGRALPAEAFLRGGRVVAFRERKDARAWIDERASIPACGEGSPH